MSTETASENVFDTNPVIIRMDENYGEKLHTLLLLHRQNRKLIKENDLTEILRIQALEFKTNKKYKDCWDQAKAEFEKKGVALAPNGVPAEYHIALTCYSTSIYQDFNKTTRELKNTKESVSAYPYKSLFHLLMKACEIVKGTDIPASQEELYCGFKGKFVAQVGEGVLFQQFLSTSLKKKVALNFAKRKKSQWTLFHIKNLKTKPKGNMCTGIQQHTLPIYIKQDEVLLRPLQWFKCTKVEADGEYGTHVDLEAEFLEDR